jgi:hypothetical protein
VIPGPSSDDGQEMWRFTTFALALAATVSIASAAAGHTPSSAHAAANPPTGIPAISQLRLSPSKFKASLTPKSGFGATVKFVLSENSVQTYVVKMHQGSSWVTLKGSFVKRGKQGNDVFPFPGVVHGHVLKKGKYELIATPKVTGFGTGKPATAHFTVI